MNSASLEDMRARMSSADPAVAEVDRRIADLRHAIEAEPFAFDRRFLFRALSMGHSQFAELIGARGPNTQVNAACASTAQALCVAEDWIRAGRCRRVVVVSADDVASDTLLPWTGSGFLASGAAATDDGGRGSGPALRQAPARDDHRLRRRCPGRGVCRCGPRTRRPADLRDARDSHRQQRLPRHPARCRPHLPGDGAAHPAGGAAGHRPREDRGPDDVRVARDLHARPRRQRGGRDQRAAHDLRPDPPTRSSSRTRRASPGTPWARDRGSRRRQGAGNGHRPAGRRTSARSIRSLAT